MEQTNTKSICERISKIPYWYHRIELPDGIVTPGWSPINPQKYGIPDDLTGKRILDVGSWDGYWAWEALKRGAAEVVAIDDFSDDCGINAEHKNWDAFDICREALGFVNQMEENCWCNDKGQKIKRIIMSVYDVEKLGQFDIVFFFGVFYHLMFPLVALGKLSAICDEIYIETASLDDYSPYKNKVGAGYNRNDVVMEFYPGKQYGNNEHNWWVPTLQCLGSMLASTGFKSIEAWPLMDNPKSVPECRGFAYASKKENNIPVNVANLVLHSNAKKHMSVAAVMSVPRLGFQDNSFCCFEGLVPLGIPLQKVTGAFWGQCLERAMCQQMDEHNPDLLLTIDYDSLFTAADVAELTRLMAEHPEADAIVSFQMGRGTMGALMTVKTPSGTVREIVQRDEFDKELLKIATGHFGLTMIRSSSLKKLPHPWFWGQPNGDNRWDDGRIDDDIYFWKQMEKHNMTVYLANRVVIGHLELVAKWPDYNAEKIYQSVSEYQSNGKPKNVWK